MKHRTRRMMERRRRARPVGQWVVVVELSEACMAEAMKLAKWLHDHPHPGDG